MKNILKLALVVVALVSSSSAFAQKFGYIDSQELIMAMPDRDSVETKLSTYAGELSEALELIRVEFNNKYNDYQKGHPSMTDAMRQVKEKELQDLQVRYEEYQTKAQQDMQAMQGQLMKPVVEKAQNAIRKVSKAQSLTAVFDVSSLALAYYDEDTMADILPLVKTELGIK